MKKIAIIVTIGLFITLNLHSQIYEFEPGKYYMLDSPVNIRSQPNTTSSVIGRLELHSEIEILEKTENHQMIEGVTHFWYKIKYNNITGYVWGGYIAIESNISESIIDINGIIVYCYYRVSSQRQHRVDINKYPYYDVVLPSDVFIYINNKRVLVKEIERFYNKYVVKEGGFWHYCGFQKNKNNEIRAFFAIEESARYMGCGFYMIINENGNLVITKDHDN